MGFIRGILIVILSVILFFAFFAGNLLLTLSLSLEEEVLKPEVKNISGELIEEYGVLEIVEENHGTLSLYCENSDSLYINEQGLELNIPCEILLSSTSEIINYSMEQIFDQIYYKNYDCTFWNCVSQEKIPLILISEKAKNYWKSKYFLILFVIILCFVLMFLISKNKSTPFIISGILLIISTLPFKKLDYLINLIPEKTIVQIVSIFITKASTIFWIFLSLGIGLILIGIAIKFLKLGLKINSWFSKEKKEEEIKIEKTSPKESKKKKKFKKKYTKKKKNSIPTKEELEEVLGKKKKK